MGSDPNVFSIGYGAGARCPRWCCSARASTCSPTRSVQLSWQVELGDGVSFEISWPGHSVTKPASGTKRVSVQVDTVFTLTVTSDQEDGPPLTTKIQRAVQVG